MIEIITRPESGEITKEQICGIRPQISYNSDGRMAIRIIQHNGDVLMVLDRPTSVLLIHFCQECLAKNKIETRVTPEVPF
jgi:hypothetical protein